MPRRLIVIASGLALALVAGACTRVGTRAAGPPDELRVAIAAEPTTLDPMLEVSDYENFVTRMVFDRLVTPDATGTKLLPRLAAAVPTQANGGISRDGRTLIYHLRHDVRWQDGVPFTSADVKFSFAAVLDSRNNVVVRQGFDLVRSVTTPDAYTVVVRLAKPFAPAITWFFGDGNAYAILPAHAFPRGTAIGKTAFEAAPIGTGPFRVVRWERGQEVVLEAFDGYYRGAPKVRRIVVRFVADETTAANLLRTQEIDIFTLASVDAYRFLRTIPGVSVALTPNHGATTLTMNLTHGPLRDVRVRRAIVAAIDKGRLARNLTAGAGMPATEDLPSFMWAYDPDVPAQRFDPAAARALLHEAGYTAGSSGIAEKGGKPLSLVLAYAQTNVAARAGVVQIQAALRAAGIDAVAKGYSGTQMFAGRDAGGVLQSGNFDLVFYTMTLGIDPDSSGRFTCASLPPSGQNYSRYCSPQMDAAEAAGVREPGIAPRKRAYAIVQTLLARDAPIDFLYWPENVDAYDARVRGFSPNPVISSWNSEEWSVAR